MADGEEAYGESEKRLADGPQAVLNAGGTR
jgi:hypothetical protein